MSDSDFPPFPPAPFTQNSTSGTHDCDSMAPNNLPSGPTWVRAPDGTMVNSLLPSPEINPAARSSSGMPNFNQAAFYNFPPSNLPPSNFAPSFVDNTAAHHPVLHQAADSSNAEPSTIARGRDFKPALKVGGARQKDRKRKKASTFAAPPHVAAAGLVLLVIGIPGPVVARLCAVAAGLVPDLLAHAQRLLPSVVSPRPKRSAAVPTAPRAMRKRSLDDRLTDEGPVKKLINRLSSPRSLVERIQSQQRTSQVGDQRAAGGGKGKEREVVGNQFHGTWMVGFYPTSLVVIFFRKSIEESDVFFVQETHLRPDQKDMVRGLEGYECFIMTRKMPDGEDTYGGVCAFVHKSLKAKVDMARSSPDILVLKIGDMHFINAYVAGEHSSLDHPPRVVDDIVVNGQGRKLVDLCEQNGLQLVNGCTLIPGVHHGFTFFGRGGYYIRDWEVNS
ncbi:hypothetical protein R3P38DRAFT_2812144 [Favolaschia claudopus]|uniref:Uncharacterized protein n=1 Tax=Favolaschia claudopus TaxID=2862362 RepID=A0AAV9Z7M2_9AGAR